MINEFKQKFNVKEPTYTNDELKELNNKLTIENHKKFSPNAKYEVNVSKNL